MQGVINIAMPRTWSCSTDNIASVPKLNCLLSVVVGTPTLYSGSTEFNSQIMVDLQGISQPLHYFLLSYFQFIIPT